MMSRSKSYTLTHEQENKQTNRGQWLCGSVGRAVASDTRCPRFESSHRQKIIEHLITVNCVLKRRNKEKEVGNGPFFKKTFKMK